MDTNTPEYRDYVKEQSKLMTETRNRVQAFIYCKKCGYRFDVDGSKEHYCPSCRHLNYTSPFMVIVF